MADSKPDEGRYIVHPESITGHGCCFKAAVIDTGARQGAIIIAAPICECADPAHARTIADALNAAHKRAAN